jgi:predicted HD phosphohydrolase
MPFTRMDESTREDWLVICERGGVRQAEMPGRIKSMLFQLEDLWEGHLVKGLEHALQTATRAVRDGASEELVVAALCHDIGTAFSTENHAAIAAEILKPYVSNDTYEIIRTHHDFQGKYYYSFLGKDPDARRVYADEPWYRDACRFSDKWDQLAFDPDYDSLPFEYFVPMIDRVFQKPRAYSSNAATPKSGWASWLQRVGVSGKL